MNRVNSQTRRMAAIAAGSALALAGNANAAAIDVADVVADIAAQAGPIGQIGVAVLLIIGAIMAFRWVRGALR